MEGQEEPTNGSARALSYYKNPMVVPPSAALQSQPIPWRIQFNGYHYGGVKVVDRQLYKVPNSDDPFPFYQLPIATTTEVSPVVARSWPSRHFAHLKPEAP